MVYSVISDCCEPIKQNNEKVLQGSVVQVENYIKTLMNSIQSQLIFLSNPVLYNKMDQADYTLLLDNIMNSNQDQIYSIYLIQDGKVQISSPFGYRYFISPERSEEIKNQTSKTGFWWSAPYLVKERLVITVSKQIDSKRVVALDLNLDALTGPQIIQGERSRIYLFTGQGEYLSTNTSLIYPKIYLDHMEMKDALKALTQISDFVFHDNL